ncbi:hypothetical protein GCM10028778_21740 [Barrientosiimonas marina]|uniref:YetF domain-containing protein n=1 Tax=Lentibacillus kimchii TaxID=1542911 RepID=A0ABW2UX76_9BACI
MTFDWIWKAILIIIAGTFLLRIAGRKSISQMTLPQTVIMIGIGTLLIQPVTGKNIWLTLAVGLLLVGALCLIEYAQIKWNIFEKIFTGKSKLLIENGKLQEGTIKKMRMTVDQLEMNLRIKNVQHIDDVEWATLEPNGQIGFRLKTDAQTVTKKEFNQLSSDVQQILSQMSADSQMNQLQKQLNDLNNQIAQMQSQRHLFKETSDQEQQNPSPDHLQ